MLVAEAFRHIAAGVGGESPIGFSANSVTRNREREREKTLTQSKKETN